MLLELLQKYKGNPLAQMGCPRQPWELLSHSVAQLDLADMLGQPLRAIWMQAG